MKAYKNKFVYGRTAVLIRKKESDFQICRRRRKSAEARAREGGRARIEEEHQRFVRKTEAMLALTLLGKRRKIGFLKKYSVHLLPQ